MKIPQDELLRLYAEASRMQDDLPAPENRSAVIAHAAMLAQSRTSASVSSQTTAKQAANWPSWKFGLVASVLLVPLLGILVWQLKDAPETQELVATATMSEAPLAYPPPTTVKQLPALPERTESGVANSSKRGELKTPPSPAAVDAESNSKSVAAASAEHIGDHAFLARNAGAVVGGLSHTDQAEATMSRSRESAPKSSGLAATPAPAPMAAAAPPKPLANALTSTERNATLLKAAGEGHLLEVQTLLREGAFLDARDSQGHTPLMLAVLGGREAVVRLLVEMGATTAAVDQDGLTALQHARRQGFLSIAALLE